MSRKSFFAGLVLGLLFLFLSIYSYNKETDMLIFYYSDECPKCHEALRYLLSLETSRMIIFKEVFYNEENYEEFVRLGKRLRFDALEVPALYDPRKDRLIVGNENISNYLEKIQ